MAIPMLLLVIVLISPKGKISVDIPCIVISRELVGLNLCVFAIRFEIPMAAN